MYYGYIRVSSDKQTVENQRYEILNWCESKDYEISAWIEETVSGTKEWDKRKLGTLLSKVKRGDTIICSEISRLGRSLYMIMDILAYCMENGVVVMTIKDNFVLGDDIQSKVLAFAFGLSAEIERQLISQRTKEALKLRKAAGVQLGRPKGARSKKTKLTDKEPAIIILLNEGHNYSRIARLLNVDRTTLMRYCKRNGLYKRENDIPTLESLTTNLIDMIQIVENE